MIRALHHNFLKTIFASLPIRKLFLKKFEEGGAVVRFLDVAKLMNYDVVDAVDWSLNQTGIKQHVRSVWRHTAPSLGQLAHGQLWLPAELWEIWK